MLSMYYNAKIKYKLISDNKKWKNINDINYLWSCIKNIDLLVSYEEIHKNNLKEIMIKVIKNIFKNNNYNIYIKVINNINKKSLIENIYTYSKLYNITFIILNNDGSHQIIGYGNNVIILYRYINNYIKLVGIKKNNKILFNILKNSFEYKYLLSNIENTGMKLLYKSYF